MLVSEVKEIVLWYSEGLESGRLHVTTNRNKTLRKHGNIDTKEVSRWVYRAMLDGKFELQPFIHYGCYGWHAIRVKS